MKRIPLHIIVIMFFIMGVHLNAQEDSAISLKEAIRICQENNLTLFQQKLRVEEAKLNWSVQKTGYFPRVFLNGGFNYVSEIAKIELPFAVPSASVNEIEAGVKEQYDLYATVRQPLFTGLRTKNQVKSALEKIKGTKLQKDAIRNSILLQLHQIYFTGQLQLLQKKVLESSLKRVQEHLQAAKNLYAAGQVTRLDTMKISTQVTDVKTSLAKLQHQHQILLSQLARILNLPEISSIVPLKVAEISFTLKPKESYLELAFRNRPEITQFKHQIAALRYQKNVVRSGLFPQIYAQASYHYARPGVNFFKDKWMAYYTFGLSLQWEIWNQNRVRKQVKQMDQQKQIVELEKRKTFESIRHEVLQAYEKLLSAREQIELSKKLFEQEKERYYFVRQRYEQGLASAVDLTDAESGLTVADLKLQQSYIEWLIDKAQMDYATGIIGKAD